MQQLAEEAARKPAKSDAEITEGDGLSDLDLTLNLKGLGNFRREGNEDTHDAPERQADEDAAEIFQEAGRVVEEHQEIAARDLCGAAFQLLKHLGFRHAQAQEKQHESEAAADEIGRAPVHALRHQSADDRAEDTDRGDEGGAVAAQRLGQHLGDERDAAAQFTRQPEAGNEPPHSVGFDGMNKAVGKIGRRIKQDGTEEQRHAAHAVAEDAKEDPAGQHAEHLEVQEQDAVIHQRLAGKAQALEAGNAQDGEQDQVIDIHEIAERANDDDRLEDGTQDGRIGFHSSTAKQAFRIWAVHRFLFFRAES